MPFELSDSVPHFACVSVGVNNQTQKSSPAFGVGFLANTPSTALARSESNKVMCRWVPSKDAPSSDLCFACVFTRLVPPWLSGILRSTGGLRD